MPVVLIPAHADDPLGTQAAVNGLVTVLQRVSGVVLAAVIWQ